MERRKRKKGISSHTNHRSTYSRVVDDVDGKRCSGGGDEAGSATNQKGEKTKDAGATSVRECKKSRTDDGLGS